MIKDYIDFVPTRLLVSTFSVSVLLDAVRLRGRHLNWLRHSWTRLKINHKLENNLCPRWWILFWEIMLGMCLMQGNQRFCHFLQRLLTSMSFSFLVLFFLFNWFGLPTSIFIFPLLPEGNPGPKLASVKSMLMLAVLITNSTCHSFLSVILADTKLQWLTMSLAYLKLFSSAH